ncbi:hypothetical protein Ancab_033071 [Ancistrocladus abbreviatus]
MLQKGAASEVELGKIVRTASPMISKSAARDSPATPLATAGTSLLESKMRKRKKSGAKKPAESEVRAATMEAEKPTGTSRKRRKSWTTLKEMAQSSELERSQRINNISIPFVL